MEVKQPVDDDLSINFTISHVADDDYCSDRMVDASSVGGDPEDPAMLKEYARRMGEEYLVERPLSKLGIS